MVGTKTIEQVLVTGTPNHRSLRQLIAAMRWTEASERLETHPEESHDITLSLHETPLSTAIRMKAPPSLISSLLESNPSAVLHPLAGSGRTPLHLCCCDPRVTAAGDRFHPNDVQIVHSILTKQPEAASIADSHGFLPLHFACMNNAPLSIISMLVYADPLSPIKRNAGGVTPIQSLWETWAQNEEDGGCILSSIAANFYDRVAPDDSILGKEEDANTLLSMKMSPYTTSQAYNKRLVSRPRNNSAAIWAKMILMSTTAYRAICRCKNQNSKDARVSQAIKIGDQKQNQAEEAAHDDTKPLHALMGISCPPSAIAFAIRVHHQDIKRSHHNTLNKLHQNNNPKNNIVTISSLETVDRDGNIPLQIASSRNIRDELHFLSSFSSLSIQSQQNQHENIGNLNHSEEEIKEEENKRCITIQHMLHAYPQGAAHVNRMGRVSLFLALENGMAWESPSGKVDGCDGEGGGVRALFEAAPGLISVKDPATHLYPFMLAATFSSSVVVTTSSSLSSSSLQALDLSYRLLREEPCIIQMCLQ